MRQDMPVSAPIFFVTGPPAAGKTTLCQAILRRFEFGIHVPVDDLREWVVAGIAQPLEWTEETTRQFQLAEEAAVDLAIRYNDAGFAVAVDHCQGPPRLDELIEARLGGRSVHKVALAPSLEVNLERNSRRTNKNFDCEILVPAITRLNELYRTFPLGDSGWIVFDNMDDDVEQAADHLLVLAR